MSEIQDSLQSIKIHTEQSSILTLGQNMLSNLFSKRGDVEVLYSVKEEYVFIFAHDHVEVFDIAREIWREFKIYNPVSDA